MGPEIQAPYYNKNDRLVDGVWVSAPEPEAPASPDSGLGKVVVPPKKVRAVMTAADRRNLYRRQAGWPVLKEKTPIGKER